VDAKVALCMENPGSVTGSERIRALGWIAVDPTARLSRRFGIFKAHKVVPLSAVVDAPTTTVLEGLKKCDLPAPSPIPPMPLACWQCLCSGSMLSALNSSRRCSIDSNTRFWSYDSIAWQ
jgi:hypothetical protein